MGVLLGWRVSLRSLEELMLVRFERVVTTRMTCVMYRTPETQSREHTVLYCSTCPHWLRVYASVASAGLALVFGITLAACTGGGAVGFGFATAVATLVGGATYLRYARRSVAAVLNPTEGTLLITDGKEAKTIELDGLVLARALIAADCSVTIEFLERGALELRHRKSASVWLGASADDAVRLAAALAAFAEENLS